MDKKKKGLVTRIVSATLGFPLVLIIFIFANNIIFSIAISIVSMICLYEYFKAFKTYKKVNPSSYLGYLVSIALLAVYLINKEQVATAIGILIPICLLILFIELVISNGKKTIIDVAVTLSGICYIPCMIIFLNLIQSINPNGKLYIWYVMIAAWGSDTCAFFIGRKFGKHKFTEISPNKTVEGAIAGVVGALIIGIIYTIVINNVFSLSINYLNIAIIIAILSLVGQIGDLAASSIKRYCNIKDYSELIPGHGGMLDRFDSVIFIIPFAYILLMMFII